MGIKDYNIYSVLLGGKRSKMSFTGFYHLSHLMAFRVMGSKRGNENFNICHNAI